MAKKVLVVDDSSFYRKQLCQLINSDPTLKVIGTAENGSKAITKAISLKPDVITMDLEMPILDGIEAVERIMKLAPTAIIVHSSLSKIGEKHTKAALSAGAIDFLPKKLTFFNNHQKTSQNEVCRFINRIADQYLRLSNDNSMAASNDSCSRSTPAPIELIAIGSSTGGPKALEKIFNKLPEDFTLPIVVIQHLSAQLNDAFIDRLNSCCHQTVKWAQDREVIKPATIFIAPADKQLKVVNLNNAPAFSLTEDAPTELYKPSINTTLFSLAERYREKVLTIILTGMGSDGYEGCKTVKQFKGTVWAQDERSSRVYSMPKNIVQGGLADEVYNLSQISDSLLTLNPQ